MSEAESAVQIPPTRKAESNTPAWIRLGVIVVAAIVGIVIWKTHHNGVAKASTDQLAQTIGATTCTDSGYYLENRLDKSKAEVYDCQMQSGPDKCVTNEGGLARDVTEEFKLTFATTLGSDQDKPTCAYG